MSAEFPNKHQAESLGKEMNRDKIRLADSQGKPVTIIHEYQGGRTARVYEVLLDRQTYALAVPNYAGHHAFGDWPNRIHQEPLMNQTIQQLEIPTNPMMEVRPMRINDITVPTLQMIPYNRLHYDVRDIKSRSSSVYRFPILQASLAHETLADSYRHVGIEIATLVANGFQPIRSTRYVEDSLNLCVFPDSSIHLYLADLSEMTFAPLSPSDATSYTHLYTKYALAGIINALSDEEYDASLPYVEKLEKDLYSPRPNNPVYRALVNEIHGLLK